MENSITIKNFQREFKLGLSINKYVYLLICILAQITHNFKYFILFVFYIVFLNILLHKNEIVWNQFAKKEKQKKTLNPFFFIKVDFGRTIF